MFGRLLNGLNAVGSAWILALMILVCTDIASRFFFNAPIRGVAEIAGFSVVAITFLQLPAAVRDRRLARADMVIARLHARSARIGAAFEAVFAVLGALVFGAILWAAVAGFIHSWQTDDQFGAAQIFTLPKWPIWLIVLVGSAAVVAAFVAQAKSEAWTSKSGSR